MSTRTVIIVHEDTDPPGRPDPFDEFFAAYPKHVARPRARREWDRLMAGEGPCPITAEALVIASRNFASATSRCHPSYLPYPHKWLRDGLWGYFLEQEPGYHMPTRPIDFHGGHVPWTNKPERPVWRSWEIVNGEYRKKERDWP